MRKKILIVAAVFVFTAMSFAGKWIIESNNLPADLESRVQAAGGTLLGTLDALGIALAEFENEADARAFEGGDLVIMPDVMINWLPPNEQVEAASIGDSEPFYPYQWFLPVIGADLAWDEGVTGAGARVAVLDTGIWYYHSDLAANIDHTSSASFVPDEPDYLDGDGHGTHVAGIIAGDDNGIGTIGVAPDATLIAVKVLDNTGGGTFYWITAGIYHAVSVNADIINMSLRGYLLKSGNPPVYTAKDAAELKNIVKKAVTYASNQGTLVVYAAGNESLNLDHLWNYVMVPGEVGNGLCISATGPTGLQNFDNPAIYTNYGKGAVDLAAPGGDNRIGYVRDWILSTSLDNWYAWGLGTSMAAPNVSGVAALVISKYGRMPVGVLKNHLVQTADDLGEPGNDDYYGKGRINAYKAVTK